MRSSIEMKYTRIIQYTTLRYEGGAVHIFIIIKFRDPIKDSKSFGVRGVYCTCTFTCLLYFAIEFWLHHKSYWHPLDRRRSLYDTVNYAYVYCSWVEHSCMGIRV